MALATSPWGGVNVSGSSPSGLALGDFDNDGDMDAAFGMHHSSVWRVLTNDGSGNLSVTASYGLSAVEGIETGDFNGDGWIRCGCYEFECKPGRLLF